MSPRESSQNDESPSLRERAIEAYDSARDRASVAGTDAIDSLYRSPLLALGGGFALGALLAAILPRTRIEEKLLGEVGGRITDGARSAASAAREAGRERLAALNITREAGQGAVQNLLDGLGEAARSSGKAALDAVRNKG